MTCPLAPSPASGFNPGTIFLPAKNPVNESGAESSY
jgi:hypothetical protein